MMSGPTISLPALAPGQEMMVIRRRKITGHIGLTYGCMDLSVFTINIEGGEVVFRRGSAVELRIRPTDPDHAEVTCLTDGTVLPFRIPRGYGHPVCIPNDPGA